MSFNSLKNKPEDVVRAWNETIKLTAKLKKLQEKKKILAEKQHNIKGIRDGILAVDTSND